MFPVFDSLADLAKDLVDRLIPDPKAKADALLKLQEMQQSGDLAVMEGQVKINEAEAASPNVFIAGWRPCIGWVLAAGLAVILVVGPLLSWGSTLAGHPVKPPEMPTDVLITLSTSLLGLAGMRSWEKFKGVEGNRS